MGLTIIVDTSASPYAVLQGVPLDCIDLIDGYWGERFTVDQQTSIRDLWNLLADPDAGHVVSNFRIAGGTEKGEYIGTDWHDAWLYKWLEAASVVFKLTDDTWLEEHINEAIELIRASQEDDGYVGTQTRSRGLKRFEDPRKHEVYTMGHLLTAAVIHRRMTGSNLLYEIGLRVGDFLNSTLGVSVDPAFAHNPSAIMGLVELYRESGEKKYLDTARMIVDSRGTKPAGRGRDLWHRDDGILGTDQIQDRTPFRESKYVVGHNVFFTYLFAGVADVYLETGDKSLWEPLERLWTDLVHGKMNLNGGVSPMGHGLSESNDIVVESVGKPYYLPHEDTYNETCGQVGNMMWNYRMLCAKPHGRFADMMEHEIYNGILSGVDLSGEKYWYRNQLRFHADREPSGHNDMLEREKPGRYRICCPTNIARTIAEWRGYLFGIDEKGIWFHHYSACSASIPLAGNEKLSLTVETNYPWGGEIKVRFEAQCKTEKRIVLRIPGWSRCTTLHVNGQSVTSEEIVDGYIAVTRRWEKGDELVLSLPMPVRLIEADPRAEHCRNQVAVMRGPVLYCLESKDLPDGVDFDNVLIPSDIKLISEQTEMPYGTLALSGQAYARSTPTWDGELYRELNNDRLEKIPIRLIPYYAWANRGSTSMSVWLPLLIRMTVA